MLSPFDLLTARHGKPSTPRQLGEARMGIAGSILMSAEPQPGKVAALSRILAVSSSNWLMTMSGLSRYRGPAKRLPGRPAVPGSLIKTDAKGMPRAPPNHDVGNNALPL